MIAQVRVPLKFLRTSSHRPFIGISTQQKVLSPSQNQRSPLVLSWSSQVLVQHYRSFSTKEAKTGKESKKEEPEKKTTKSRKEIEDLPVDFSDISRAHVAIKGGVKRTESVKSVFLSEIIGANIYLKPEIQQFTGSFKERGARNAILSLLRQHGSDLKGVIAASAGNHALALAYHGKDLGVPVTVVMPVVAPLAKVDKCRVSPFHAMDIEQNLHFG